MTKVRVLLALGVWVTILPYLGFPYSWKDILFTITGLALIYVGYLLYSYFKEKETKEESFDNFKENSNFDQLDK